MCALCHAETSREAMATLDALSGSTPRPAVRPARDNAARMRGAFRSIPECYRWARLDSPLLRKRAPSTLIDVSPLFTARAIVLHGDTGAGKTSLMCALMQAIIDAALLDGSEQSIARAEAARFVAARDCTDRELQEHDRKRFVALAQNSPMLFFDDVGQESPGVGFDSEERANIIANILDRRHRRAGFQTWITTPRVEQADADDPANWGARYGAGGWRRYFDMPDCVVLEMKR
jgi:hypothetical protein